MSRVAGPVCNWIGKLPNPVYDCPMLDRSDLDDTPQNVAAQRGRGRPSRAQAMELSDAIIEAALQVFRLKGYAATTMDDIAASCCTAKHSIYRRFPSKEALFAAAVAIDRQRMLGHIQALEVRASDPLSSLRDACRSLLAMIITPGNVDLYRMCAAEAPRFPVVANEFARTRDSITAVLEPLVENAQKMGLLTLSNATQFARQLGFFVTAQALHEVLLNPEFRPTSSELDNHFDSIWRIVMFGALPRT
ncbi:TetR/AcrR family transcriptional regulator [Microvirga terricola]|uniref:TetR/AcrR family transcriptional regulator n=1 Tax=Microvirga terricola TaxID=2719797 RepID=A0ABX0V7R9_9HYPH|nr:TetR/AcrR family transcriptional regulator [Microvirga terricola]NIX75894.1 TetR/AcrR family transcriptional regulator [Microvirga terricola]